MEPRSPQNKDDNTEEFMKEQKEQSDATQYNENSESTTIIKPIFLITKDASRKRFKSKYQNKILENEFFIDPNWDSKKMKDLS